MNEVTYTFSRALHMMRYGGSVMRPICSNEQAVYSVIDNDLRWKLYESWNSVSCLDSETIMGSWIEVK